MEVYATDPGNTLQDKILECRDLPANERDIILHEGVYFLDEPLCLGPEDSGLSIRGQGRVQLVGGERITGFRQRDEQLWAAPLEPDTMQDFRMLRVNGRWADRARYPEQGYLIHRSSFTVRWKSTYEGGFEREPTLEERSTMEVNPADIPGTFVATNAEITVYHMWDESLVGVREWDPGNNCISFSNPAGWPPGAFADNYNFEKRYVIWNTAEGMLRPGQWYLDRQEGELVYWPREDEDMDKVEVIAPLLEHIIIAEGREDQPVSGICIEGLELGVTNAPLMSGAFGAKLFDGALSLRNTDHCSLRRLRISNVGGHGIKADGNHTTIEDCTLEYAGAGAIRLTGSGATVRNNHIHHIGRTFPSAIALYVGATDPNVPEEWEQGQHYRDCSIVHNEIHHVPYAAICVGGAYLKITDNLIYEAMQDLYDGAGIYITFCRNALLKHNFIRDIKDSPGAGTSAYYLDEKAVDCLVEENVEINVPRPSHNHIARNNVFRNNVFVIRGKGYFSMERSENYTLEKNIIVATEGFDLYDMTFCPHFRNNVFHTPSGRLMTKDLDRYEVLREYELELKDGNVNTDPGLLNYEDGRILFAPDSPAPSLGIKEFDVSGAGIISKNHIQ